jgi:hypothetical protein
VATVGAERVFEVATTEIRRPLRKPTLHTEVP